MTEIIAFEGKQIKITKDEYDTFVSSITTQNPTPAEIKLYLYDCDRRGVHPLDKLIYFTKRRGRYVPIVGIDYMRIRAESSGHYAGSDDAEFFYLDKENGDKNVHRAAKVTVWKIVDGQRCPFTATARWEEYRPEDMNAPASFMWKKMPHTMLAKCAEALALRKAFPGQLAGLYTSEEMAQDGRYVAELQDRNAEMGDDTKERFVASTTDPRGYKEIRTESLEGDVDADYPMTQEAKTLAEGFTQNELRNTKQIEEIAKLSGKTASEILTVINALAKGEKRTVGQIVKELIGDTNGQ